MLKSVLAAIPTYAFSCFQLPDGVCKEITSLFFKFLVGTNRGEKKDAF